jgi:hypothetical protein
VDEDGMKRIICDGATIEGVRIPPFSIEAGESVCILWPVNQEHPAIARFHQLLAGHSPHMTVEGTACFAENLWWETTLFGIRCTRFVDRHCPGRWLYRWRQRGWLRDVLTRNSIPVATNADIERHLDTFRSPTGSLVLESSDRKFIACLLCEAEADMTIFNQFMCTKGKLIGLMERVTFQNAIIEYRFADVDYYVTTTYRNARIIRFEIADET